MGYFHDIPDQNPEPELTPTAYFLWGFIAGVMLCMFFVILFS